MVVTKLGSSETVGQAEVEANNWMGALRGAREKLGESGSIPPGASCNVSPDGGATLLDPITRRRFELKPLGLVVPDAASTAPAPSDSTPPTIADGTAPAPSPRPTPEASEAAPAPARPSTPNSKKRPKFQTVAYMPGEAFPGGPVPPASAEAPPQPGAPSSTVPRAVATAGPTPDATMTPDNGEKVQQTGAQGSLKKKRRFETVAFTDALPKASALANAGAAAQGGSSETTTAPQPARAPSESPPRKVPLEEGGGLTLLLERDEEPTADNPLRYRERAYAAPPELSLSEAEAALRWKLADLQRELDTVPKGKLVNLAVFDHGWTDRPSRPPIIVLQWRDWRDEITVDFPAAQVPSSAPSAGHDDALADLFEALHDLPHMASPAHGLRFAVELMERVVPSDAFAACLYDINTDELRFVAVAGTGAEPMQGRAVARTAGLVGQAARNEDRASVYPDVELEPAFVADVDGRPGLEARNLLYRPVTHDGHLLGMLQLINRRDATGFLEQDLHLVNYLAERLGEFLQEAKFRRRSEPPRPPR